MTTNPSADPLIREVRGHLGRLQMSQEKLAEHLGLSRNSVVQRLHLRVPFTAAEVRTMADLFGVDPNALYGVERAA